MRVARRVRAALLAAGGGTLAALSTTTSLSAQRVSPAVAWSEVRIGATVRISSDSLQARVGKLIARTPAALTVRRRTNDTVGLRVPFGVLRSLDVKEPYRRGRHEGFGALLGVGAGFLAIFPLCLERGPPLCKWRNGWIVTSAVGGAVGFAAGRAVGYQWVPVTVPPP